MKRHLLPLALALWTSTQAHAARTTSVVYCMDVAMQTFSLTTHDSAELCRNASTTGPIACYRGVIARYPLIRPDIAATLCQSATTLDPVTCLELLLGRGTISMQEAAKACQGVGSN